jgi:hypothetical protein
MAHRLGRRFIALVAAYALALNALLAPFAMPASAAATAWAVICTAVDHSPSGDKLPIGHRACPMGTCSLAGCGALVAFGGVGQIETLLVPGPGRPFPILRWHVGALLPHAWSPHLARAPPAV